MAIVGAALIGSVVTGWVGYRALTARQASQKALRAQQRAQFFGGQGGDARPPRRRKGAQADFGRR